MSSTSRESCTTMTGHGSRRRDRKRGGKRPLPLTNDKDRLFSYKKRLVIARSSPCCLSPLKHAIAQFYNQLGALLFHSAASFCTRFIASFPLCSPQQGFFWARGRHVLEPETTRTRARRFSPSRSLHFELVEDQSAFSE